jgi:hypothetical protein
MMLSETALPFKDAKVEKEQTWMNGELASPHRNSPSNVIRTKPLSSFHLPLACPGSSATTFELRDWSI